MLVDTRGEHFELRSVKQNYNNIIFNPLCPLGYSIIRKRVSFQNQYEKLVVGTEYLLIFRRGTHLFMSLFPSICPSLHRAPYLRNRASSRVQINFSELHSEKPRKKFTCFRLTQRTTMVRTDGPNILKFLHGLDFFKKCNFQM